MYSYPGVYIEHVPSGALAIAAASTSTAAFIGPVTRGALVTANAGEPSFIFNVGGYERLFGPVTGGSAGIADKGAAVDYMGHAVNAFFTNGGTKAYIVPIGDAGPAVTAKASIGNAFAPGRGVYFEALSPGAWANNLTVQLSPDLKVMNGPNVDPTQSTYRMTLGTYDYANKKFTAVVEQIGGISLDPASPDFVALKLKNSSAYVSARDDAVGAAAGQTDAVLGGQVDVGGLATIAAANTLSVTVDGDPAVNVAFVAPPTSISDAAAKIQADVRAGAAAGTGRAGFQAQVTPDGRLLLLSGSSGPASRVATTGGVTAQVLGLDPTVYHGLPHTVPNFATLTGRAIRIIVGNAAFVNVPLTATENSIAAVAAKIQADVSAVPAHAAFKAVAQGTRLVMWMDNGTDAVSTDSTVANAPTLAMLGLSQASPSTVRRAVTLDYPTAFDGPTGEARSMLVGGVDAGAPDLDDYKAALGRLKDYRDVSILLLPGKVWDAANGKLELQEAIAHAEFMQNRMVIVDPPAAEVLESPKDVQDLGVDTSPYAALYYPWLTSANPFYDPDTAPDKPKTINLPPSAFAAGLWARIDGTRGVWKAPAGLEATVRGALGPTRMIGNELQGNLNDRGVNVLRSIIGPMVIWGARTVATLSKPEFRYIPVRRTQSMIGESLYLALQAVVFEPNNHVLWSALRAAASGFMDTLFRAGAFQGEKASDAYYVRCGLGQTMEQADIDAGVVILEVAFAPLKPAEFVVVKIRQIVGQKA